MILYKFVALIILIAFASLPAYANETTLLSSWTNKCEPFRGLNNKQCHEFCVGTYRNTEHKSVSGKCHRYFMFLYTKGDCKCYGTK
ncbi:hypothetical protein CASFOL_001994 [Castilleja foliolosa]|uniref:Uncharacterized protein n=1 Tax=Castilleja foliolosa TaxID=1961234 RepID=A0ABD3ED08_9LAMI